MLYHLLYPFHTQLSVLNVTRYITFRTAAATMTALLISLVMGPWLIRRLRDFQIGQVIRQHVAVGTHAPGMCEVQRLVCEAQHRAGVADIHGQKGKGGHRAILGQVSRIPA